MADDPFAGLTPRERVIAWLVLRGRTNKESARELHVSLKTVQTHRAHLNAKLGVHSTSDLLRFALERGLLQVGSTFGGMTQATGPTEPAPPPSTAAAPAPAPAPTVGRIVLFGFARPGGGVTERAALVVHVPTPGNPCVNLEVFTDGSNDDDLLEEGERSTPPTDAGNGRQAARIVWRTSVTSADDPAVPQAGRWRWPPRA